MPTDTHEKADLTARDAGGLQPTWLVAAIALALGLATAALFARSVQNEFILLDDPTYVRQNPLVASGLTADGVIEVFDLRTIVCGNWHPLTVVSHMVDVELFGLDPAGHHAVNAVWHALSTALLFWLLARTTGMVWTSAVAAALFGWHPLRVESVAWVAERKDVLSTFMWIAVLVLYTAYARRPSWWRYGLVAVALIVGLLTKPMLVTMPVVLLLWDWWPLGRFQIGPPAALARNESQTTRSTAWWLAVEKLPLLGISLASSFVTVATQASQHAVVSLSNLPLLIRVANAVNGYVAYITKTVWPERLAIFYPYERSGEALAQAVVALPVLLLVTWLVVHERRQQPNLAVGWLWYLIALLPVIGLVQVGSASMADRYTYVPSIGLAMAACWFVAYWAGRVTWRRVTATVAACAILMTLAAVTWRQIGYWQNTITLFEHATKVIEGNFPAHEMVGNALVLEGQFAAAVDHFDQAIKIRPEGASAHYNRGSALFEMGRYDEALESFDEALERGYQPVATHLAIGRIQLEVGRLDEARQHLEEVLRVDPTNAEAKSAMRELARRESG